MSNTVVDVFCENYVLVDWEAHALWIAGHGVTEAVAIMREKGIMNEYPGVTLDLLVSDLNDQFRLFSMLENLLLDAGNFSEQLLYQLDRETQERLIERYYGLDDAFCREVVGKKLSSRLRKDLDEIADRTGILLKSCRRQFDNIKRVFKTVEDMPGGYVANVMKTFSVSQSLAEKYGAIVMLGSLRFELHKKRLNGLTFDAIRVVALHFIGGWMVFDADADPALDKEFLGSLKCLKALQERDKEHRNIVCSRLKDLPEQVTTRTCNEIEANFRTLTRNMLTLGLQNKEVKDFFVHVTEKICEPLRAMQLERGELTLFLSAYTEAVTDHVLLIEEGVREVLQKYMSVLTPCILSMY